MMKRFAEINITFFVVLVLFTGIAVASSGEGHETSIMDWVWRFVNFGILVAALYFGFGKMAKEHFRKRTELIERSIKEASEAKASAEKALKEIEERLTLKDHEIDKIMESATKMAEADRDKLIEEGEKMSDRIREQAKINIEHELKQAKEQLKADAALLSLEIAEKKIKEKLSREDQIKILEESLKKIEEQNG